MFSQHTPILIANHTPAVSGEFPWNPTASEGGGRLSRTAKKHLLVTPYGLNAVYVRSMLQCPPLAN